MGGTVLGISAETAEDQRTYTEGLHPNIRILADPEREIIGRWGLTHRSMMREVARPALLLVGPRGRIRWTHLTHDWKARAAPEEVWAQVEALKP